MPRVDVVAECPVHDSFRVQQVAGMFDVPLAEKSVARFEVELPDRDEDWSIGLIVGPSGSGKSTIARRAYAEQLAGEAAWHADRAVIDGFGDTPVRQVVELFTAVGFGSPPSWIKPYHVLSGGERFRCDLARALARAFDGEAEKPLVVFDEFTSVVDRGVAKIGSAAIAKGIRRGSLPCRFVAVTCHYDVAEWLEPDWVLDMATARLERRRLRRPSIELEVHRCELDAWRLFARHHYLTASLSRQARCYLSTWDGEPVAFAATLPTIARKGRRRFTRIVTLPDFQGVGVGGRLLAGVATIERDEGYRMSLTSSHPAMINHCRRSPDWQPVGLKRAGAAKNRSKVFSRYKASAGRVVVSFEYRPRTPAA